MIIPRVHATDHVRPNPDAVWDALGNLLIRANAKMLALGMALEGGPISRHLRSAGEDVVDALEVFHVLTNHFAMAGPAPKPPELCRTADQLLADAVEAGEMTPEQADLLLKACRAHDARRAAGGN
jgi:hypothetical protein